MKKRFDYYEFRKNVTEELLKTTMSVDEYVSAVVLNVIAVSYVPLVAILYIVSHIVAILVFNAFELDYVSLTIAFNKLISSLYVGVTLGFITFAALTELKHKSQTLRNLMLPPVRLTLLVAGEVNTFKKYSLGLIILATFVFITTLVIMS